MEFGHLKVMTATMNEFVRATEQRDGSLRKATLDGPARPISN